MRNPTHTVIRACLTLTAIIGNTVLAQDNTANDALAPITSFICSVGTALSGPIAIAVGLVLIATGGIAIAVGGRRAMGTVLWGVIGITIATSAAALTTSLLGDGCSGSDDDAQNPIIEIHYANLPPEIEALSRAIRVRGQNIVA